MTRKGRQRQVVRCRVTDAPSLDTHTFMLALDCLACRYSIVPGKTVLYINPTVGNCIDVVGDKLHTSQLLSIFNDCEQSHRRGRLLGRANLNLA